MRLSPRCAIWRRFCIWKGQLASSKNHESPRKSEQITATLAAVKGSHRSHVHISQCRRRDISLFSYLERLYIWKDFSKIRRLIETSRPNWRFSLPTALSSVEKGRASHFIFVTIHRIIKRLPWIHGRKFRKIANRVAFIRWRSFAVSPKSPNVPFGGQYIDELMWRPSCIHPNALICKKAVPQSGRETSNTRVTTFCA